MKTINLINCLLLINFSIQAQVTGRTIFENKGCWSMISVNGKMPYLNTDGEGNFTLTLTKQNNHIFILSDISIEIKNIPNNEEVNIGEIFIPKWKSIEVEEYLKLSNKEKKYCKPIYHWTQLIGYEYTNQLSEPCITLKCEQTTYKICDFRFNHRKQKIIIDWKKIKPCKLIVKCFLN